MSFTANEVLEIAIQIERNGVTFYERAAELAEEPAHRNLLLDLAKMEADHEKVFVAMQASLSERQRDGSGIDADGEVADFVRAIADGHVFDVQTDPGQILTGEEGGQEVLSTAIGLEKESVVYFSALKEVVPAGAREKVDEVIREEMNHIAMLRGWRTTRRG